MKKILLILAVIIVGLAVISPKKSPPFVWVERTTTADSFKGEAECTSTTFTTIKGDNVVVFADKPNTIVIISRHGPFDFGNLIKTAKVKVGCYDSNNDLAFSETLTLQEVGSPLNGQFTSKRIADWLRNTHGRIRIFTELSDGKTFDIKVPTWATRRPIRAPNKKEVDEKIAEITDKISAEV